MLQSDTPMNQTESTYEQEVTWICWLWVGYGKYHLNEERYIDAKSRKDAFKKMRLKLKPNEHLNGISLIPAKEYWALNSGSNKYT